MKHKWTVLFLVHASNEKTHVYVEKLFDKLKSTIYSEEIKVLVLYGGLQSSVTSGYRTQVTLKEIVKDNLAGHLDFNEVLGYGRIDIGDDKKLDKIFSDIRIKYPSDRFLLFTWDHGSGFGIFKTDPRERGSNRDMFSGFGKDSLRDHSRFKPSPEEHASFEVITNIEEETGISTRDFGGLKGIEKKKVETSMLTNDELRNIIKYGHEANKVDLLIMMNCAMQMIETGYALNDAVEYLVAPETCTFWAGYDYQAIIDRLCTHPETDTEAIARYAVDSIESCYEKEHSKKYYNDLVTSLVKPSKSLQVKKVIDEIADQLIKNLPDAFDNIKNIRRDCEDLTAKYVKGAPYQYVDFLSCIAALKKAVDTIDVEKVKRVMQEYIIHMIKGSNYRGVTGENNTEKVNGCTIYFPDSSAEAKDDVYYDWFYKKNNQQTLFAANCLWQNFLVDYIRHDRDNNNKRTFITVRQ